jgi:hypothetical protein
MQRYFLKIPQEITILRLAMEAVSRRIGAKSQATSRLPSVPQMRKKIALSKTPPDAAPAGVKSEKTGQEFVFGSVDL